MQIIKPSIRYTYNKIYTYATSLENYLWPINLNYSLPYYHEYNKIDNILVDGIPVQWETRSSEKHPCRGMIGCHNKSIEIQYSNMYDKYRYIVKDKENVENVCSTIIYLIHEMKLYEHIIYAKLCFPNGESINYTKELNQYLPPYFTKYDKLTYECFIWDKMYFNKKKITDYKLTVYMVDWRKNEYSFNP
jgi:hypothetical protein